jgi:hypothetical protein
MDRTEHARQPIPEGRPGQLLLAQEVQTTLGGSETARQLQVYQGSTQGVSDNRRLRHMDHAEH